MQMNRSSAVKMWDYRSSSRIYAKIKLCCISPRSAYVVFTPAIAVYWRCFLSACIGVYIGWGDAFTLKKFYLYIGYNKVLFAVLFNYAIIQLFFIATGRQYTALILSQILWCFWILLIRKNNNIYSAISVLKTCFYYQRRWKLLHGHYNWFFSF